MLIYGILWVLNQKSDMRLLYLIEYFLLEPLKLLQWRNLQQQAYNVGISTPGKDGLYIETGPWYEIVLGLADYMEICVSMQQFSDI